MPYVTLPLHLREYVGGESKIHVRGRTIDEALANLSAQYPAVHGEIIDTNGEPQPYIHIDVNGEPARSLSGPLNEDDVLGFTVQISGGADELQPVVY
jgi:hypothetical protein